MFREPIPCQLTVMVMVTNQHNEVLTLERTGAWPGITFPGGHLEAGESVLDCARREVLEETGIQISDLRICGLIHWSNRDSGERYLVWCLRAQPTSDTLRDSPEGPVAWHALSGLEHQPLSAGFADQLKLFTDETLFEAFGTYGQGGDSPLTFDRGA